MADASALDFAFLDRDKAIHNIVKVNHAGEFGAIRIYRGQLLVSRLLHRSLVPILREFLSHEESHFRTFDAIVSGRGVRRCSVIFLWAVGGWTLGLVTALLGRRAIMACTAAIEETVDAHLAQQVAFLAKADPVLCESIQEIRIDEQLHRDYATAHSASDGMLLLCMKRCIRAATEAVIWASMRL